MHGQGRAAYKARQKDPQVAAKLQQKANNWRQLTSKLAQAPPDVAWELTETLLKVNPDPLYIWNQRRTLFLERSVDDDLVEKELGLTASALQSNPKAYGAWFHRKWVLTQAAEKINNMTDLLQRELGLTELFLQRDERNFHCWNYRRFVVALQMQADSDGSWWFLLVDDEKDQKPNPNCQTRVMGSQVVLPTKNVDTKPSQPTPTAAVSQILRAEWEFTHTKIGQNFSNFSAFHCRSKLFKLLWTNVEKFDISAEFQLVEDAVFTEPDDQTAWWYQDFLLDCLATLEGDQTDPSFEKLIQKHLENLTELAEEVTECKWVRLGMLRCLAHLPDSKDRQRELWQEVIVMDPDREARYRHMLAKLDRE
uniref:Geranylgeranyl transferase type-2 subunit alpha n=1 Tax=Amphora coffeiformis TaxID=265554 RepID=A0A7S3PA00_9STRA|mmetsp:Transcript_16248/g.32631  ORF Transcript_16248/g.32631 Transcript_16248/m.32631 type:complete len:365 (+) Transcript_16248:73-1167(+)|eukprot:scaffold10861_cov180-Amphora_coffeaeformis.AAC.45